MIRLFTVFCKLNFKIKTAKELFDEAIANFKISIFPCPRCGSRQPEWEFFSDYERNLFSFVDGECINEAVTVPRYECISCGHTHAIIPEIAIPYSQFSIFFVISVMHDRFVNKMIVEDICQKYDISIKTFYRWVKLYKQNKLLWLGVIEDAVVDPGDFIAKHPSRETSELFYSFWLRNGLSFFQHSLHGEKMHFDIRLHPPPAFSPDFHIT